jgi:hypothetical protein
MKLIIKSLGVRQSPSNGSYVGRIAEKNTILFPIEKYGLKKIAGKRETFQRARAQGT